MSFDALGGLPQDRMRRNGFRLALSAVGVAFLGVAAAFLLGWPPVTRTWPFMLYGLAPIFIASLLAAMGAPILWIGLSGEFAALRGGAANVLVAAAGIGGYCLWRGWGSLWQTPTQQFAMGAIGLAMASAFLLVANQRTAWLDSRPTPALVRGAFVLFCVVLVLVGGGLVLRLPVFPWSLDMDSSVIYGAAFLGAALYFAIGVLRPVWGNAKGQLLGFLAYDLVLIVPWVRMWTVSPGLSLGIYIAVLVVSGALALGYLVLSPTWRLWPRPGSGHRLR